MFREPRLSSLSGDNEVFSPLLSPSGWCQKRSSGELGPSPPLSGNEASLCCVSGDNTGSLDFCPHPAVSRCSSTFLQSWCQRPSEESKLSPPSRINEVSLPPPWPSPPPPPPSPPPPHHVSGGHMGSRNKTLLPLPAEVVSVKTLWGAWTPTPTPW